MSVSVSGTRPDARARVLKCGFIAVAVLAAGGCAENRSQYQYAEAAKVAGYVAEAPQIEGDGLPSQPAPPMRNGQMPDDPTAPYSRNYGGWNPSQLPTGAREPVVERKEAEVERPYIPHDLPEDFRRRLAAAVDTAG